MMALVAIALFVIPVNGQADASTRLDQRGAAKSASVPSPSSFLGFNPGDDRTIADWNQITKYFELLDKASDRIAVQRIGTTTLNRPLIVAVISAPENLSRLDKIKALQRKLSDPRSVQSEAEQRSLMRDGKAVVAISCSIHSTEIVASQMSMQLAYDLAVSQDTDTQAILQETILLLIPSANPDGIDIVANWYRKTLNTSFEGTEPPELYHHYAGHDNNRDWFMLNLRETQHITRLFWKEWFPHIVYDVHQMGQNTARFFIPPFYDPFNPEIDPSLVRYVGAIGHKIAADLQSASYKGVITNAIFDMWWHGGFRTAPYYHNSIGVLSEAASARLMSPTTITGQQLARTTSRGMPSALQPAMNFPDPWPGGLWRPKDILGMEMVASRAVLEFAAKNRRKLLENFERLNRSSVARAPAQGEAVAYLIPAGQANEEAISKLISTLIAQNVEIHRLDRELHVSFVEEPSHFGEVPAGSFMIFVNQPARANVRTLFETQVYPERKTATGEIERPYDVAGWTLPLQMGIETQRIANIQEQPSQRRFTLIQDIALVRRGFGLSEQRAPDLRVASPISPDIRIGVYKSWRPAADEGWTRFVLDTFSIKYRSLSDQELRTIPRLADRFDAIIIPSQDIKVLLNGNAAGSLPEEYVGGMGKQGVENLRKFVEAGGTLICLDAATDLAIKSFNLPIRNVVAGLKSPEFFCPGSILAIETDPSHSVMRRQPPRMDAYFINSSAFEVTDSDRVRVIARYARSDLLRSGFLRGGDRIAGKVALAEVQLGKGRIILFGFRPQHRGQTWGTFPLLFNALERARRD